MADCKPEDMSQVLTLADYDRAWAERTIDVCRAAHGRVGRCLCQRALEATKPLEEAQR